MSMMLFVWSAPENQSGLISGESEPARTEDIPSGLRLRHSSDHLWPALQGHGKGCLDVSRAIPSLGPCLASLTSHNPRESKENLGFPLMSTPSFFHRIMSGFWFTIRLEGCRQCLDGEMQHCFVIVCRAQINSSVLFCQKNDYNIISSH